MDIKYHLPRAAVLIASISVMGGCATTLRGAPEPLLNEKSWTTGGFDPAIPFNVLSNNGTLKTERNKAILTLLSFVDIRYMGFRNDIAANSKHSRAVSSGLTLATDIAASLTNSRGVKDNYIALSQIIQGGETIYSKEYLFQRTLDALVAQMDASRRAKLVEIRVSMNRDSSGYPPQAAAADILDYYYAGTINGAIVAVQRTAGEDQAKSTEELKAILRAPSYDEVLKVRKESDRIGAFMDTLTTPEELARLDGYLSGRDIIIDKPPTDPGYRFSLRQGINDLILSSYDDNFEQFVKDLETNARFTIPN